MGNKQCYQRSLLVLCFHNSHFAAGETALFTWVLLRGDIWLVWAQAIIILGHKAHLPGIDNLALSRRRNQLSVLPCFKWSIILGSTAEDQWVALEIFMTHQKDVSAKARCCCVTLAIDHMHSYYIGKQRGIPQIEQFVLLTQPL